MNYRELGKTGLRVSEIGFGGEWLDRHDPREAADLIRYAGERGVNIIDCWMSDPVPRRIIGEGIKGARDRWYIQGHIGSTWQDGQYVRSRDMQVVKPAFEGLLECLGTDYIDLGMIHFVDEEAEWQRLQGSEFLDYVLSLKQSGVVRHIGLSTHNPIIGRLAAESGFVEMILFSVNPAFDLMPPSEDIDTLFADEYDPALGGIAPERAELYRVCESRGVGITVMKGFAGGRLFDPARSPFGTALTPVQCLHYCLTRPAVASVMCGFDTAEQVDGALEYLTATDEQKDYATVLANAPRHAYSGQCTYCGHCRPCPADIDIAMVNKYYDLAAMQPEVPATLREHYNALAHKADECIGCKSCESRCPFGVKIAERMGLAARLLG